MEATQDRGHSQVPAVGHAVHVRADEGEGDGDEREASDLDDARERAQKQRGGLHEERGEKVEEQPLVLMSTGMSSRSSMIGRAFSTWLSVSPFSVSAVRMPASAVFVSSPISAVRVRSG